MKKPGVYRLSPEKRIDDAVNAAGGPTAAADLNAINLAAKIEDGSRIEVPTKSDAMRTPPRGPQPPSPVKTPSTSSQLEKFTTAGGGTVNINTSDPEELQRLPGVGPAMAERILLHRKENGPFSDPEQLMDVAGIGEKKFAKMKPFVRVR